MRLHLFHLLKITEQSLTPDFQEEISSSPSKFLSYMIIIKKVM